MFFDMPVNKTTCHCIGPAYADFNSGDTKDNQGPLGGKILFYSFSKVLKQVYVKIFKFKFLIEYSLKFLNLSTQDLYPKKNVLSQNVHQRKSPILLETIATKMMAI